MYRVYIRNELELYYVNILSNFYDVEQQYTRFIIIIASNHINLNK